MVILHLLAAFFCAANSQSVPDSSSAPLPVYVSLSSNINDFGRFADGGSDENWYIGFNNAWIVQLPPPSKGEYSRAFIGAKIGRAKTQITPGGEHWERSPIPGKIYMALSPTPSFSNDKSFFLTDAWDIPVENDPRIHLTGTGPSRWFWTEVPLSLVNFSGPNYLIVWSPTPYFVSSSSAPILAALEESSSEEGPRAWNNRSLGGVAPRKQEGTLETPLRYLKPALALRLSPRNDSTVIVRGCAVEPNGDSMIFKFSVAGENIESAWLELSLDKLDWERYGRVLLRPPYQVTIPRDSIPGDGAYFRAVAIDSLGNEGACQGLLLP